MRIAHLFDDIVCSAEVGMAKPEAAVFHLAAERLGVPPARCVFVDDWDRNVEAAQGVGMKAVLHRADRGDDLRAQLAALGVRGGAYRGPCPKRRRLAARSAGWRRQRGARARRRPPAHPEQACALRQRRPSRQEGATTLAGPARHRGAAGGGRTRMTGAASACFAHTRGRSRRCRVSPPS